MDTQEKLITRTEELERCFKKYSDHPKEAIVKADTLRLGLRFSKAALKANEEFQRRSYFIFSYDMATPDDVGKETSLSAPEDIRFKGGIYGLRPTVIQGRLSVDSPYLVDVVDGKLMLCDGSPNRPLAEVELRRPSKYYSWKLSDGTEYWRIVQETSWGTNLFTTVFQHCQFWDDNLQCKFCDMNANVAQQKGVRPIVVHKRVEDVVEVLKAVCLSDEGCEAIVPDGQSVAERRPRFILIEGGTITHGLKGKDDTDFYLEYIEAIKEAVGNRFELSLGVEAKNKEDNKRLYNAGVNVVLQDMEVWDKRLYPIICPGKAKYVGDRDEWVRRMVEAVDVFGEGHVQTALVGGVEMAQPYGFKDIDSAVNSTTEGFDYLLSHGVHPELFVWAIEPGSALAGHPPIPLEYYIRVNENHVNLWKKYRQPVPTYIQPIGPGNATLHLSPYLDAYC